MSIWQNERELPYLYMHIVFLVHPAYFSQSMPRFARLLANGMKERGHTVEIWAPITRLSDLNLPAFLKKWLAYIGLYLLFPLKIKKQIKKTPADTLFVITDNALGPWVPLVANHSHVIHCNDFLAQRSAIGEIPENSLSWTGKKYQAFIRRGYTKGSNFISISEKTKQDLHSLLPVKPAYSEVVYLGLNQTFKSYDSETAKTIFGQKVGVNFSNGYMLHVGGNQWYKNRIGVIEIYDALRSISDHNVSLVLIGVTPSDSLAKRKASSPFANDIYVLTGIPDATVQLAYAGASVFLFPSLAEGFGWPIAEAMAAGCPVVTTNEAPMTEVAGDAGFLIRRRPTDQEAIKQWAYESAAIVSDILDLSPEKRSDVIQKGYTNTQRFDPHQYLNKIESVYKWIMANKL